MSLFDTIIGRQQLQSLPPEQQDQARRTARSEFILNSLLGGRGLASGFEAARGVVPSMQAAQQRQRMEQARQQSMVPTGQFTNQPMPGSQLDLIRQQMGVDNGLASLLDDRAADSLTSQSLIRGGQGTGLGGSGLSAQQQLVPETRLDPTRFAELASQVLPASDVQGILKNFETVRPKINDQGVMTDIQGNVIGSIPTFKDGVQTQFDRKQDSFVSGAVPGYQGAVIQNYVPQLGQGMGFARDAAGNVTTQLAPGYADARATLETIDALGAAAGQVEEVYDEQSGRMIKVPRTAVTGAATGSGRGAAGGGGGLAAGQSVQEEVLTRSQGGAFETRVKTINEKGQDAARRAFQANQLYDNVSQLDPTALTAFGAAVVPYIRAIPGFRDLTDKFATNTALLGQQYASGVLGNFSLVKGNLNAQEVRLVEDANWQKWDPRTATRYVATLEAAFADRDAAEMEFANTYQGDFRQYDANWKQSPTNQSVFNHPMMTRFVIDEVREAQARSVPPNQLPPNLPPGFKVDRSVSTREIRITKPDGTIMMMEN